MEELPASTSWMQQLEQVEVYGQRHRGRSLQRLSSHLDALSLANGSQADEDGQRDDDQCRCLDFRPLWLAAHSQQNFLATYSKLSNCALELLSLGANMHSVQQTLLDIARVSFYNDQKEEALRFLSRVFALQAKNTHNKALRYALAMYTDCLKDTEQYTEYAKCLLALLGSGVDNDSRRTMQGYSEEIIRVASLVERIEMPLDTIALVVSMARNIVMNHDGSSFTLAVNIRTVASTTLTIETTTRLRLRAVAQQEPSEIILRGPSHLELSATSSSLQFFADIETEGWYEMAILEIDIGNFHFTHRFQQDAEGREPLRATRTKSPASTVLIYPSGRSPTVDIIPATEITLGRLRKLHLQVKPGNQPISACSLRLRAATAGLRLHVHDSKIAQGDSGTTFQVCRINDTFVMQLEQLERNSPATIDVPYSVENVSEPSIAIKCELNYTKPAGSFTLYKTCQLDIILPVSVNVQDIHRNPHCFSRFLISPATLMPILLRDCSIDESKELSIVQRKSFGQPVMVFPHQPAHWTAKIMPLSRPHDKRQLQLNVYYQCLDELLLNSLKKAFLDPIGRSDFAELATLLCSHLVRTVKTLWTEQDLEVAGMTREIDIWSMADLDWRSVLCALDSTTKSAATSWLSEWHSDQEAIPIDLDSAPVRKLSLVVDLPPRPPFLTAAISIQMPRDLNKTMPLGQPIMCTLDVEAGVIRDDKIVEYTFDLLAPQDVWLIGGRKRGCFPADRAISVPIVLFPQRSGSLLLPMIDIRCRVKEQGDGQNLGAFSEVPVEVHNKTISKAIVVRPCLASTTVSLDYSAGQEGQRAALVDSRHWTTAQNKEDADE